MFLQVKDEKSSISIIILKRMHHLKGLEMTGQLNIDGNWQALNTVITLGDDPINNVKTSELWEWVKESDVIKVSAVLKLLITWFSLGITFITM